MLTKEQKVEKLISLGGKHWTNGDMERIYFNCDVILKILNIEIEYYNTGNIYSIYVDGERKSNSVGKKALLSFKLGKFYYDIATDDFYYKDIMYGSEIEEKLKEALIEGVLH